MLNVFICRTLNLNLGQLVEVNVAYNTAQMISDKA